MRHFESIDRAALQGAYLSIGSFDGLHRGHRHLLERMVRAAKENDAPPAVLTFFPHPRAVLASPDNPPFRYLTTLEDRLELLGGFPLEALILQPFDRTFSRIQAGALLTTLKTRLGLRSLWCGTSFSMGAGREGNIAYLTEQSSVLGFSLCVVPPLADREGPISSSRIRRALAEGDPAGAARLLGRRFSLSGKIVHGEGRGRKMDTPTANLELWPEMVLPCFGVYATWAVHGGRRLPSVTSIGVRPTFERERVPPVTVETHVLDFHGDLYGSVLKVEFAERLRPERRFPDMDGLRRQMAEDIRQARDLLKED